MWYPIWYALGIFTGVYITSIHFRLNINKSFNRFVAWIKDVIERNKKIKRQQEEIETLKQSVGTVKVQSPSKIADFFKGRQNG